MMCFPLPALRRNVAVCAMMLALGSASSALAVDGYYGRDDNDDAPAATGSASSTAQIGVRISALEEQLRAMQGQVEQANFQARQAQTQMQQMQQDIDFRLRELENRPAANAAAPAPAAAPVAAAEPAPAVAPVATKPATAAADKPLPKDAGPNEQYNQAFRLLNQSKYDEAYAAFKQFTSTYPKDPLVGNAYYWMGESYYVRRDYTQAADHFRQGFEAMPKGPKAGDNLLKLAMSLSALNRNSEGCIVLRQVVKDYTGKSSAVVSKANNEMARIGCK